MRRSVGLLLLACISTTTACRSSQSVVRTATSRFPRASSDGRLGQPICFPAARSTASLAEQALWDERMAACARAARAEGVAIAAPGSACLHADMTFASRFADKAQSRCDFDGCATSGLHTKTLRLFVRDPQTSEVLLETVAMMESDLRGIADRTVYALCAATFRGYPQPIRNGQQRIELPK